MLGSHPYSSSWEPGSSLDDVALGSIAAASTAESFRGAGYTVHPVGRIGEREILLCEADIGAGMPGRSQRCRWRDTLAATFGDNTIVVFTDGAHSSLVWSWRTPGSSPNGRLVEYRVPPRGAAFQRAFKGLGSGENFEGGAVVEEIERAALFVELIRPLRGTVSPLPAGGLDLMTWIERLESPEPLRSLWRSLTRLTILDLTCGDGWLLGIAPVLGPVYLACIDRMRGFIDDASVGGVRRRPEYLRDFRSVVELAEDQRRYATPGSFARSILVQRNLYGVDRNRTAANRCRRLLLASGDLPRGGLAYLDANVRHLPAAPGDPALWNRDLRDSIPHRSGEPAEVRLGAEWAEETTILGRAFELVRQRRLERSEVAAEMSRASLQLERRRRSLLRRISRDAMRGSHGGQLDAVPLFFPWLEGRQAFRIVRGLL